MTALAPTLRGRERELASLLRAATRPAGAALVLDGEPGSGRTALLDAAADAARGAGVRTVVLRAPARAGAAPLQLVGELLAKVPDPALPDTARLDEVLLAALRCAAAEGPTLIAVDDADRLDDPSWAALVHAARHVHDVELSVLLVTPAADPRAVASGLIRLAVAPLAPEASEAVLADAEPDLPIFVRQRILEASAGNPLALRELALANRDEWQRRCVRPPIALPLTPRLVRAFNEPVLALPEATQELLLAAAANDGESLSEAATAAARTLGVSIEATLAACLAAVQHGLVEGDATTLRFRSEVARSAVYQGADLARRRALHLAFAEALERAPGRRAWHRAAVSLAPDEALAAELELAAAGLRDRGRLRDALATMDRAARVSEDPAAHARRLLAAAWMGFEIGRPDFATAFTEHAGGLAEDAGLQRDVLLLRSLYDLWRPDTPQAVVALLRRAEASAAAGDPAGTRTALTRAIEKVEVLPEAAVPREALEATAERLGGIEATPALAGVLTAALPVEHGEAALATIAGLAPDAGGDPRLARLLGEAASILGHDAMAIRSLTAAIDRLRAGGRFGILPFALVDRARAAVNAAGLELARLDAEEAAQLAQESGQAIVLGRVRAVQALIEGIAGNPEVARERADEAERAALDRPALLVDVHVARGLTALVCDDHESAYAWLMRLWEPSAPMLADSRRRTWIGSLAEAALVCGEADAVRPLVHQLAVTAAAVPSPALRSAVAHARAVLATTAEDSGGAFLRARVAAAEHGPLSAGRVHLAYGTWLRRERRVSEARLELRSAVARFDQVGARPWSDRARAELRAAGQGLAAPSGTADELTAQERQIAELAAAGLTNREIGKRLYLSHRTVSTHLYRVFPKLGITSRAQLRDALAASA